MWASQRAASNFTEIKNLQVNAPYTVRVSVSPRLSPVGGLRTGEMGAGSPLSTYPLALGAHHRFSLLNKCPQRT